MTRSRLAVLATALAMLLSGCGGSPSSPSTTADPCLDATTTAQQHLVAANAALVDRDDAAAYADSHAVTGTEEVPADETDAIDRRDAAQVLLNSEMRIWAQVVDTSQACF